MGYGSAIATILFIIMDIYIVWFLYRLFQNEKSENNVSIPNRKTTNFKSISLQNIFIFKYNYLVTSVTCNYANFKIFDRFKRRNYWGIPTEIHFFENIQEVFIRSPMARFFLNSLIITIPTTLITLLISSMSGFTLAIHKFRLNMIIFAAFIAGNFIPFQILLVPVRSITIQFGIYDTWFALIIFHIAFQSGFCTFFLRNFIKELPFELIEAARADGASEFFIYKNRIAFNEACISCTRCINFYFYLE